MVRRPSSGRQDLADRLGATVRAKLLRRPGTPTRRPSPLIRETGTLILDATQGRPR